VFDTTDKKLILTAVVATLQDLGFMIAVLDDELGIVSGKRFEELEGALFYDSSYHLYESDSLLAFSRRYLGWGPFDEEAQGRLTRWLTQRATDDLLPTDLVARAEVMLWHWQIVLPALSTLEEIVTAVTTRVQEEVYTRIVAGLTPELRQALDEVLTVPSGDRKSTLFYLKEYPPEASAVVILRYIERYHFLQDLGVGAIDLRSVRPPLARYLADITKRYDVRALRRFAPDKRYALTACFLVEVHKTILDYIVALHDQLLTRKWREAKNAFEQRYRRLRRQYRRGLATLIATGQTLLDPARSPDVTAHLGINSTEQRGVEKSVVRVRGLDLCRSLLYTPPSSSPTRCGVVGVRWSRW
jgi:hypothetical protein